MPTVCAYQVSRSCAQAIGFPEDSLGSRLQAREDLAAPWLLRHDHLQLLEKTPEGPTTLLGLPTACALRVSPSSAQAHQLPRRQVRSRLQEREGFAAPWLLRHDNPQLLEQTPE